MSKAKDLKKIRTEILDMASGAGEGHIPSALSVVEILYVIHSRMESSDDFFLSKGHASVALYAVLSHFGKIHSDELKSFCSYNSHLGGHPHRNVERGIMNSSGSLGHGLPIAVGFSLAKKNKGEEGKVFCLVGDGECNEGSIWEAALYASHLNLSNLICIVDNNNSQIRAVPSGDLSQKFKSFGWKVFEVKDGHDVDELEKIIFQEGENDKPICIIAYTKKGKGVKEMEENMFAWHHRAPTKKECEEFKNEILGL